MSIHELSFGAKISDSLVEMLKRATASAQAEWEGALPCLCLAERGYCDAGGIGQPSEKRINFERESESVPSVNRLEKYPPHLSVTEFIWMVCFDKRKWPPQTTFVLDGVEVHIDQEAQASMKG